MKYTIKSNQGEGIVKVYPGKTGLTITETYCRLVLLCNGKQEKILSWLKKEKPFSIKKMRSN